MNPQDTEPVVEIITKSFWTGSWTYRVLKPGPFWVFAKFKFGKLDRLLDCRVYGTDDVRVSEQPGGILVIEAGGRTISPIHLSPETRDRLLRLSGRAKSRMKRILRLMSGLWRNPQVRYWHFAGHQVLASSDRGIHRVMAWHCMQYSSTPCATSKSSSLDSPS